MVRQRWPSWLTEANTNNNNNNNNIVVHLMTLLLFLFGGVAPYFTVVVAGGGATTGLLPYTCAPGTTEAALPFCNRSLGFRARSADLAARLNLSVHVQLFFSYPGTPYLPGLNLKRWALDHTCIHGLNKYHDVTVFPHAIAQGASFDLDLVKRVSNATAREARILSAQDYVRTGGQSAGDGLSCDGGPLANHIDPRWGRISETYGECPTLVQAVGVMALQSLQNPQPVRDGHADDRFMATRQVTRHYIGYHSGSGDKINGTSYNPLYNASNRSLADTYFPIFGAYQRPDLGAADGIMCAMTELNGVPSCANPLLMTKMLRDEWGSDAIVQTDCCDSLQTISRFGYKNLNDSAALALSVNAGLGIYFGFWVQPFKQWMMENLGNGTIAESTVRAAGQRVLLTFMRLGFFDMHANDYPFSNASLPWSMLDGPEHRALAREAAAKSTVLLRNVKGTLPLSTTTTTITSSSSSSGNSNNVAIAVVGPFARCLSTDPRTQNGTCYLHSYNGFPSSITDIYTGILNASTAGGSSSLLRAAAAGGSSSPPPPPLSAAAAAVVTFSQGSNSTCGWRCAPDAGAPCWEVPGSAAAAAQQEAAAAAAVADVTILVVGLGASVEAEGCDRFNMTLPPVQQALYNKVADHAKKLVVVIVSAGGVDLGALEGRADAIVWAPYGGEEAGSGLADVLFGRVNPSARLPLTWYTQTWADAMANNVTTSMLNLDLDVGLGRTYRYLDPAHTQKTVTHMFGFGLSYTTFSYSNLTAVAAEGGDLTVEISVTNTGHVPGAEVVQAYISGASVPGLVTPFHTMIAFAKTENLAPGATVRVALTAPRRLLETAQNDGSRAIVPGPYTLWVGGHQPGDAQGAAVSGKCQRASITLL